MLNKLIVKALPFIPKPIVKIVAGRYIAGPSLNDAVRVTKELEAIKATTTIDVLGEFVSSRDRATHECKASSHVIDAIAKNKLKSYLSVKPTSLGLDIDEKFGYENIRFLVDKAAKSNIFVRMDMENSPYTSRTLDFYRRLREDGYDNIGVVIQAYMRRSEDDIRSLLEYKPNVRLCKGIYVESADIAFKEPEEIRSNYKKLFKLLVENGASIGIATHDEALIKFAENYFAKHPLPKDMYEFQMLLGVREDRRDKILKAGHRLRVYVPFGEDWYGYSVRRLKENPAMAGHIMKAILTGK